MLQQRLAGFDPLATLQRGYAYASTDPSPTGTVLSAATAPAHTPFVIRWHDGYAWVTATSIHLDPERMVSREP
jgi:exonuclease VII large subunit